VIGHAALQDAVRAVGIAPVERLIADAARKLRQLAAGHSANVYYTSIGRFVLVLEGGDAAEAERFVKPLLHAMQEPSDHLLLELHMHAGMVVFTLDPQEAADALRKATAAVHQATRGERAITLYEPAADEKHRRSYALLRDIPRALADDEFHLVYQPKFNVSAGRYLGVEALLRWTHRELGNIPPGEFIPLVENTALIHSITEWVLHTALQQLAQWRAQGMDLAMAVNVSARNLAQPDFLRVLHNAHAVYDIPPEKLHIECTENAALTGETTLYTLDLIRAMGMQVSLDDFGIGYCNLSCLHNLPAELLKLDQSLIRPITTDARALALLKSIVSLGHTMGYRLLAEGVETQEVYDALLALGVDQIQGYYLSRPLLPDALVAFMRNHTAAVT
jgi:EAL domain-containing protein (putative c-di-GMP-specific phosphodiesterase class I)